MAVSNSKFDMTKKALSIFRSYLLWEQNVKTVLSDYNGPKSKGKSNRNLCNLHSSGIFNWKFQCIEKQNMKVRIYRVDATLVI